MTARINPNRSAPRRAPLFLVAAASALSLFGGTGCGGSSSAAQRQVEPGTYAQTESGDFFFVDESFGGQASSMRITRQFFGRLVSIVAFTDSTLTQRTTVHEDFVIDPKAESDWDLPNYALETNPITGGQTLVIYRDFSDETTNGGREQFRQLLAGAAQGTRGVSDNGFFSSSNTMVPRNAAFVVVLDDLINADSINADSVRVVVGDPAIIPFSARVFADPNHGDLADFDGQSGLEFYSTRVIVDLAVSELESFGSNPFLPINTLGLPASTNVTKPNIQVRFASVDIGQLRPILQNPTQHALTIVANGTVDFASGTFDVVRLFRSGGRESVTNDPYNGFLPDETPPVLVGSMSCIITDIRPTISEQLFELDLQFLSTTCAQEPRPGDILVKDAIFSEVVTWTSGSLINGVTALNVLVRLVALPPNYTGPSQFVPGPAEYRVEYNPAEDSSRAACFVRISPGVPDANFPTTAVDPRASFAVRFNEAMDPDQLEPYETMRILRTPPPLDPTAFIPYTDFVPGAIRNTVSFQEFRYEPQVPLSHAQGAAETYYLDFPVGLSSARDLAGNLVAANLPVITFDLNPTAAAEFTGGRVTRFQSEDEEPPFADLLSPDPIDTFGKPEWHGQLNHDLGRGRIRPRPVVRTQIVVSTANEIPAAMQLGTGTTLPLTPFGARTQFVWRYIDFGERLPLNTENDLAEDLDLLQLNIDVEGVSLSPLGGNPVFESFPEFQMSMAHAQWLPDELINPLTGALIFPQSGLQSTYDGNLLDALNDPLQLVHARELGYVVQPAELSLAADGTPLIPLPMNPESVPAAQRKYYTWRDTAITRRGAPNGAGAPVARVAQITGVGPTSAFVDPMGVLFCDLPGAAHPFYLFEEVHTAALPLLIDLRCYPTGGAVTANVFNHQFAHATTLPGFRAYSAGGRDQAGSLLIVDPDSESTANGGFDPTSTPAGASLPGVDNTVYYGALDLVVRISRVHSIYFPAVDPFDPLLTPFSAPTHVEPIVFPEIPPQGTRIDFSYRGAASVTQIAREDASQSDAYGDFYETTPLNYTPGAFEDPTVERQGNASCFDGSFSYEVQDQNANIGFTSGDAWRNEVSLIDGSRWFQVRISFTANVATGQSPEIASIGFAWRN